MTAVAFAGRGARYGQGRPAAGTSQRVLLAAVSAIVVAASVVMLAAPQTSPVSHSTLPGQEASIAQTGPPSSEQALSLQAR